MECYLDLPVFDGERTAYTFTSARRICVTASRGRRFSLTLGQAADGFDGHLLSIIGCPCEQLQPEPLAQLTQCRVAEARTWVVSKSRLVLHG